MSEREDSETDNIFKTLSRMIDLINRLLNKPYWKNVSHHIFIEFLFCARYCAKHWSYINKQHRHESCPWNVKSNKSYNHSFSNLVHKV